MKKILYSLVVLLLFAGVCEPVSAKRKKKGEEKEKKEQKTPYQKLFDGKKMISADGLMKIHLVDGKTWVEFPLNLLGKDMALASSITETSDNGEGIVGQFAGRVLPVRFSKGDSTLQMRVIFTKKMLYDGREEGLSKALDQANIGGIFKTFKIKAYTPDSTAVVVDMTPIFMEHSFYTNPFAAYAANSFFRMIDRRAELEKDKSCFTGIAAYDDNIVVKGNYSYSVNHYGMGMLMYQGIPVTMSVDKFLMLLPEEPMHPRIADARIGVRPVNQSVWNGKGKLKRLNYTRRWRLEPVDEKKYAAGELVDVKKPIVFYMDTIFPQEWKPYIKAGVEEWNTAFEKIGLKNVIRVMEFPKDDPRFDANNIKYSTIRYAPLWMSTPDMSMHIDSRTGEILNSSMYIFNNFISRLYFTRAVQTMATDPRVRAYELPEDVMGEMIRVEMMQLTGRCLGLSLNPAGAYAYPVDSLRSASFTRKYGLAASVLNDVYCNYIAQPEDVEKGARLTPAGLGEYDMYAIHWLYKPIPEAKTPESEKEVLDGWIREKQGNPAYRFAYQQPNLGGDPTAKMKTLGNDHIKALEYTLKNIKIGMANYFDWFTERDKTLDYRRRVREELVDLFTRGVDNVASYIGGIQVNEVYAGDAVPSYEFIPKSKQKEAMNYLLALAKDVAWVDDVKRQQEFEIKDLQAEKVQMRILGTLLERISVVELSAEKGGNYSPEDYVNDLYRVVWEGTLKKRSLSKTERELQLVFLGSIITTSTVTAPAAKFDASNAIRFRNKSYWRTPAIQIGKSSDEAQVSFFVPVQPIRVSSYSTSARYYDLLLRTRHMLREALPSSTGDTRQHYEYLLFKIKQSLEKKK